jgi:hypothetical protein
LGQIYEISKYYIAMKTKLRIRQGEEYYYIERYWDSLIMWGLFVNFPFTDKEMAEVFCHCLINKTEAFELVNE